MGKQYPLGCPLRKNNVLDRGIFLIYALPFTVFEITMGRTGNDFDGKLT